jgi:hypothetical protein
MEPVKTETTPSRAYAHKGSAAISVMSALREKVLMGENVSPVKCQLSIMGPLTLLNVQNKLAQMEKVSPPTTNRGSPVETTAKTVELDIILQTELVSAQQCSVRTRRFQTRTKRQLAPSWEQRDNRLTSPVTRGTPAVTQALAVFGVKAMARLP